MIKKYFIVILLFFTVSCTINENIDPGKSFIKFYGSDKEEVASKLIIDDDQNYVFIGTSSSYGSGSTDIMVVKTDSKGNKIWEKYFGGILSDSGVMIRETLDRGYIIVGNKTINDTTKNTNILLIKLDNNGNKIFEKEISRLNSSIAANDVIQTSDGGYAIGGSITKKIANSSPTDGLSNIFIVRTDQDGNEVLFYKDYGINSSYNNVISIFQKDGDFFEVLNNRTYPNNIELNTLSFNRFRPRVGPVYDITKADSVILTPNIRKSSQMIQTKDGGYIIIGTSIKTGNESDFDMFLLKLDVKYTKQWYKEYDFTDLASNSIEKGEAVVQFDDGSYGIVGSKIKDGQSDILISKITNNGDVSWSKLYGGASDDYGKDIKITSDGEVIILSTFSLISTPNNRNVISLLKLNSQGELKN